MASLYERIRWYYFGGQQKTAKDIEAAAVLLSTEYAATPTPTSPESVTEEQKVSNGSRKDSSPSVTTSSIVSSANSTSSAMPARPSNHRKLIREKSQGQMEIYHHKMGRDSSNLNLSVNIDKSEEVNQSLRTASEAMQSYLTSKETSTPTDPKNAILSAVIDILIAKDRIEKQLVETTEVSSDTPRLKMEQLDLLEKQLFWLLTLYSAIKAAEQYAARLKEFDLPQIDNAGLSTPDRNSEAGNHSPSKTDSPQHAAKGHPLSTDSNHPNGSSPTGQVNQQTIQDIRKARIDAENADAKNRQEVIRLIIDALRAWHIYRLALVRSLGTHEIYYGVREDLDVFSFNGVKGSFNEEGMPDWAPWLESGFFVGSLMYIPLIALGYYDTPKTEFERARRVFEILDAAVWTLINFSRYNGAGASGVTTTILNLGIGAMLSLILLSLGYFFDLVNQCYFDYKNKQEQERFKKIEENKIENLKIIQEKFSEKNPKLALKFLEKYNNTFYGAEKNVTDLTNLQKTLAANPTTAATAIEAVYKKIISAENIASASDECKTIALDLKAKRENITQTLLALDIRETLQNNISKLTQLKAKLASNPETSIEIIKKDFEGIISATDESKSYSESIKIMKELETLDDKQGNKEIVTYKEKIDALQKVIATEIIENKQIIKNTFDNFAYAKKIAELQEIIKLELENFERAKEDNRVAVASVVADECRRTETEIKAQRQKIIEEIAALGEITPQNQEKYNEKIQKLKALIALEIQNHEKFTKELQSKIDYFYNWSLKWNIAYALFLFSGAIIALAVGSLLLLGSAFIAGATLVNQTKNLIQAYIDCENTIASCNKKEQFLNKLLETPSIAAINVMLEKNGLPKIAEKQTLDQYIATQRHHHRNDKQKLAILNQLPSNENLINHGFAPMAEGQNFAQYVHEQRTAIKCDRAAALKKYDLHKKWYAFVILTMVIMLACPWPLIALSIFLTCFLSYTAYKSYNHKHTWEADPDKISCTTTASLLKKYRDEINGHTDNLTKVDPAQGNPFLNGSATSSRMITSPTGIITKPAQTVAVPQNSVVSAGKLTNAGLELDQNGRLCPRLATIN